MLKCTRTRGARSEKQGRESRMLSLSNTKERAAKAQIVGREDGAAQTARNTKAPWGASSRNRFATTPQSCQSHKPGIVRFAGEQGLQQGREERERGGGGGEGARRQGRMNCRVVRVEYLGMVDSDLTLPKRR
jgi:hypothetical protein